MSNRRHARRAERRSHVCVFCEIVQRLDHIATEVVPTLPDDARGDVRSLLASIGRDVHAIETIAAAAWRSRENR